MLDLKLIRRHFTPSATMGELFVNGQFFCFTLEDVYRPFDEKKKYGETAIPFGRFKVLVTFSEKFKKFLPLITNVPGFSGIRFHGGNKNEDSLGCILIGAKCDTKSEWIGECAVVVQKLTLMISTSKEALLTISIDPVFECKEF